MDDDPRFWVCADISVENGNSPEDWEAAGTLVGIVDEAEGGIVAYCHAIQAGRVLAALQAQQDRG